MYKSSEIIVYSPPFQLASQLREPTPGQDLIYRPAPPPALVHLPQGALAAAPPLALAAMPDALALLKALRRRWLLAAGLGLLCAVAVAGAAYCLLPPAKYTARAVLHVATSRPRVILPTAESEADFPIYVRTQVTMIKSRLVLNAALNDPKVVGLKVAPDQADPIEWLAKEIQVEANGEILHIGMSSVEAQVPMLLANAVTRAYLREIVDLEARRRRTHYESLKAIWVGYQETLRQKREELKKLALAAGSDSKPVRAILRQFEADHLGRAQEELARCQAELRRLQVEAAVLRKQGARAASAVSPAAVEDELGRDQTLAQLAGRVAQAQDRVDQATRLVRNPNDPVMQTARRELEAACAALVARRTRLRPLVEERLREQAKGEAWAGTGLLQDQIDIQTELEELLQADVRRLSERSHSATQASIDLSSIQEEISHAEAVAKRIGSEVEILTVELKAPPRVQLLEEAALPHTKDEQRRLKVAGLAGLGALGAVLGCVSLWEFRARRIDSVDEVVRGLGLRLVGALPARPDWGGLRGASEARVQQWESQMVESVTAARTALLHAAAAESIRVVMVASALGGEGKTSLACHLASSLARAGRRTLLVDGDLRRPAVHQMFDLPAGPGLSEVLRDEAGLDDVTRPAPAAGLWVLPAGRCNIEAIRSLARADLRTLFDRLRGRYDFVVVDSAPVLPVADSLLIGQHVDAVLFSILRGVSRVPTVYAAYERLSSLGIRQLGAVVTGAPCDLYSPEYQYAAREPDAAPEPPTAAPRP